MAQYAQAERRTILIVDDEPFLRYDLVDRFEDAGYDVLEAGDADEAIALLDRFPQIDTVLTDVQMPGSINGVRLAHHVRERFPPVRLVVASGAVRVCAADLPADAMFLTKPFDIGRLVRELSAPAA